MTVADVAVTPLSDLDHRTQLRRAVIASTVGTTIEWYDFLLMGWCRPCSCPASDESGKGFQRQRSTPCPRTSTARLP